MTNSPKQRYLSDIAAGYVDDSSQQQAIDYLEMIYFGLLAERKSNKKLLQRWRKKISNHHLDPQSSLYLWGSVGTGKTYLMDIFVNALPKNIALRMHFHQFMTYIHNELTRLQGQKNPLQIIAAHLAKRARVLCFDEFLVNDIADAMILAGLLEVLFSKGMLLVTTSNIIPDELYHNGLQRQKFFSAIELIKQHCNVLVMTNTIDYRLRHTDKLALYSYPLNKKSDAELLKSFKQFSVSEGNSKTFLVVQKRKVKVERVAEEQGVVWFEFSNIIGVPRSQGDYLELVTRFNTIIVSGVPKIKKRQRNLVRAFINFVDVLYDARVRLILSADCPIDEIYPEGPLWFEFQRSCSRLKEMQSAAYNNAI